LKNPTVAAFRSILYNPLTDQYNKEDAIDRRPVIIVQYLQAGGYKNVGMDEYFMDGFSRMFHPESNVLLLCHRRRGAHAAM
jgi:hypothetical protein